MPTKGTSITICYLAWNTSTNAGETGDVENHTLKWIKDGTASSPTNSPSEVDSTNCPGLYKITMTGTEAGCLVGILAGKSSTSDVSIMPILTAFETPADAMNGALSSYTTSGTLGAYFNGTPSVNVATIDSQTASASGTITFGSTVSSLTAANVWAQVIETGLTALQTLQLIGAVAAGDCAITGPVDGAYTVSFKQVGGATVRIAATTDNVGNRSSITITD